MSNKLKAKQYHTAVSNYDESTIIKMVREDYIQHNPKVPTGRAAFVAMIPKLKEHGSKIENIRMFEDGKHIIMHHKWINAAPFGFDETAAFHIIRFDDEGLIAEHWNVMAELGAPNGSGRTLLNGEIAIKDIEKTENNKAKIEELFNVFINDTIEKQIECIPQFFNKEFHQHNPHFADGIQSLTQALKDDKYFPRYNKQHVVFGEGNFVLSISEGMLLGIYTAFYDLFKLKDDKITAHWHISQEIPATELANTNTMFNF